MISGGPDLEDQRTILLSSESRASGFLRRCVALFGMCSDVLLLELPPLFEV